MSEKMQCDTKTTGFLLDSLAQATRWAHVPLRLEDWRSYGKVLDRVSQHSSSLEIQMINVGRESREQRKSTVGRGHKSWEVL